jgi:glycine/D-amino acid oxidase-like deaminating enzyme
MRVLICGGGVIGTATAYFLSRRGIEAIVIERTGLACAASGKSGGFLALDWCDGTPLEALARRSYSLHAKLAGELGGGWGYRGLATYSGFAGASYGADLGNAGRPVEWLAAGVKLDRRLGSPKTTAQVDPAAFTLALMRAAEASGARLHRGAVTGLLRNGRDGGVQGVELDGETIKGDAVVIAMGPWSIQAAEWLPLPGVFGLKGSSLLFETGMKLAAQALFLDYQEASGTSLHPEIFPRVDGTTYVSAGSSNSPLPLDPAAVTPDPGAIERLEEMCSDLSPAFRGARILKRQACYRPVTRDGLPLIGQVPGVKGAYVASGHSVWGILNAPATGEAVAELIIDGRARTVDLAPFDPGRLPPLTQSD